MCKIVQMPDQNICTHFPVRCTPRIYTIVFLRPTCHSGKVVDTGSTYNRILVESSNPVCDRKEIAWHRRDIVQKRGGTPVVKVCCGEYREIPRRFREFGGIHKRNCSVHQMSVTPFYVPYMLVGVWHGEPMVDSKLTKSLPKLLEFECIIGLHCSDPPTRLPCCPIDKLLKRIINIRFLGQKKTQLKLVAESTKLM